MKTLVTTTFIVLILGMVSVCFADGNEDVVEGKSSFHSAVYPVASTMKLSVKVNKAQNCQVDIRLLNQMWETLTVLKLGKDNESSTIRFDLNTLEDGQYRVEVSDGIRTEVKTVTLQTRPPVAIAYRSVCLN
ncbi:hypothetical protein ACFQ4C_04250 [Larkinella insperata]|uniref:Secretion system C-terminal sorting domain-containing protein n=1 Tax=Larkinella insperata TaxID=332158 RepID=A0ABW3Q5D7_9BACT|nr:hypothetical protein [Larkinella insperata]